jgi:hypothetical protein
LAAIGFVIFCDLSNDKVTAAAKDIIILVLNPTVALVGAATGSITAGPTPGVPKRQDRIRKLADLRPLRPTSITPQRCPAWTTDEVDRQVALEPTLLSSVVGNVTGSRLS